MQSDTVKQPSDNVSVIPEIVQNPRYALMAEYGPEDKAWEDFSDTPVFGGDYQRNQIVRIIFLGSMEEAGVDSWDVSASQDGTVLAWVKPNRDLFDLYIGAEGGVLAPEDCRFLFADYINLCRIDFNGVFDTTNVTSMECMFDSCISLAELDVSGFDTSNVTDMSAMFSECNSLTKLDVSSFNVSKVIAYDKFMGLGQTINGRPWEEFFT